MKILQINSVCGVGSTGRIVTDLYKALKAQGHECKVAYGRGIAPEWIDSIKIGSNLDNYYHVFKTRVLDKHGFGSVNATKKFIEKVKEYDPDVIHLHNIHGYYINIEILFNYLKEANKRVIWTLHDCWALTGHCSHFDYIGCDKWKTGCEECIQQKEYPASNIRDNSKLNYLKKRELFTSIKNMTIITPSNWLAAVVKQSFLSKYEIKVINNGVDLDIFKPVKSNFRCKYGLEDKIIILGVSNVWNNKKGLNYFVDLADIIDDRYKIIMVGVNKNQKKYLPKNILAITKTNNPKELAKIYSAADVFINPSVEETMGLVTVEAIACGTPVIVSNKTAVPEVINDRCGMIIKNNPYHVLEDIIKLCNEKNKIKSCIERAKIYNKDNIYGKYILLYKEDT